jgi:hypothetical protein
MGTKVISLSSRISNVEGEAAESFALGVFEAAYDALYGPKHTTRRLLSPVTDSAIATSKRGPLSPRLSHGMRSPCSPLFPNWLEQSSTSAISAA